MLPFEGGQRMSLEDVLAQVRVAQKELGIEGITFLGGEPFAHAAGAAAVARQVRQTGLTIMAFSGYTLEELQQRNEPEVKELLQATDILVDGPYVRELPDTERRWIGSTNQRIHFLTERYRSDDPCWRQPNTLEIRLEEGEVRVNGFPAKQAVGLWKRPLPLREAKPSP
jgi:anaerobic ribonucleoside-triphosphate reductase activating protein